MFPILNSPYAPPARHWELDDNGEPTRQINHGRRPSRFFIPIPRHRPPQTLAQQQQEQDAQNQAALSLAARHDRDNNAVNTLREELAKWRQKPLHQRSAFSRIGSKTPSPRAPFSASWKR